MTFEIKPPMSQTDKWCLAALAALWLTVGVVDVSFSRCEAEPQLMDKPALELTWEAPMDQPRLLEAITLQLEPDLYREDIPLDRELQAVLREACEVSGVPVALALGLIEVESGFDVEAISSKGAYGLCQLNPKYFPSDLAPAENIQAGVVWLGELLERHEDTAAALRAYNFGWDDGDREFANAVLAAAEKYRKV